MKHIHNPNIRMDGIRREHSFHTLNSMKQTYPKVCHGLDEKFQA